MARRCTKLLVGTLLFYLLIAPKSAAAQTSTHFAPNIINFWYDSTHRTTNFGPAFRDTVQGSSHMLPRTAQFALCFHSGAEPFPCELTPNKKYANCTCTVETATNYVLLSAMLNYPVYLETLAACGSEGSSCPTPDGAPVCADLAKGKLIPGAQVISTFDRASRQAIVDSIIDGSASVTQCDGLYAGCMTAPCKLKKDGNAVCTCPVFDGRFMLLTTAAGQNVCNLGGVLVNSASYIPSVIG